MASSSEGALQRKVIAWLESLPGCRVMKIIGGPYQEPGISDLLICYKGRFIAIELKAPGRIKPGSDYKPSSLVEYRQVDFINSILTAGGIAFVADSLELVKNKLAEHVIVEPAQSSARSTRAGSKGS